MEPSRKNSQKPKSYVFRNVPFASRFFVIIKPVQYPSHLFQSTTSRSSLLQVILMHEVSNNISPPQISNLFNYQHSIHSYNTRSSTRGNFFLKCSRLNKQNMSFSMNGVRIWNRLSDEFRQMPEMKFKHNIHNMLLQKPLEADECIDLSDLNMP